FYAAASHRLPHLRRMYILLTDEGKCTEAYRDFTQFRAYWTDQIARLSRSPVWIVPLEFRVEGLRHRYNDDKTMATVRYIVKVVPRSQSQAADPVAEYELKKLVVKGSDGQWYVNDGTLAE